VTPFAVSWCTQQHCATATPAFYCLVSWPAPGQCRGQNCKPLDTTYIASR
jgi:hypothetical protein